MGRMKLLRGSWPMRQSDARGSDLVRSNRTRRARARGPGFDALVGGALGERGARTDREQLRERFWGVVWGERWGGFAPIKRAKLLRLV